MTAALAELGLELELSGWAPWRLLRTRDRMDLGAQIRAPNASFWRQRIWEVVAFRTNDIANVKTKRFCLAGGDRSHDQCACGEWAGEEAGGWISCTERISAPFALMPVALPFANAVKKSRARGPWIRT